MAKSNETDNLSEADKIESETLREEEKKKKARLRKRGPYRKAHADW